MMIGCWTSVKCEHVYVHCIWITMNNSSTHTHTSRFYGRFPWVSKFTPMVFQDNLGWPFSPQLKWINSQISVRGMDSTEVPPSWPETILSTNTCFIRHYPNQSEHHATLLKIILNNHRYSRGVLLNYAQENISFQSEKSWQEKSMFLNSMQKVVAHSQSRSLE
jgi:hypothetical protein